MEQKKWRKFKEMELFILGTYGERLFLILHTVIKRIPSSLFCTLCLLILVLFIIWRSEE
ncbi:hypothetical protein LAD12857_20720 [Lacrimispora amygdalina]|uniref:Uncharacterized protein n=1 Tax=Lacrimispora amygdalina TaxID=253257 RepID=A0ABQ5M5C6_9FIRM